MRNLETTGVGRVVNGLRSRGGAVGILAKTVVITWKNVVKTEITDRYYDKENYNS